MINACRFFLSHFSATKISHVMREGNRSADSLAGSAFASKCSFVSLDVCPPSTSSIFAADYFGIPTQRGIG